MSLLSLLSLLSRGYLTSKEDASLDISWPCSKFPIFEAGRVYLAWCVVMLSSLHKYSKLVYTVSWILQDAVGFILSNDCVVQMRFKMFSDCFRNYVNKTASK